MLNLNEIIEHNAGPELKVFEREIEKLTQKQLEQLVVIANVYKPETASGTHRDFLEIGAAEVTWANFFRAYREVMGHSFILDE